MTTTTSTPSNLGDLTGTWTIDPDHTRIGFVARHAMVTKVRGAFNEFEGAASVDAKDFSASQVNLTIRTASIDTRNDQRDDHLRSSDFLGMYDYPEIRFASTRVIRTSPNSLALTGSLTIKNVTKAITVPFDFEGLATDPYGNLRAGFEGSATISRKDYGITWNAALDTGGVLVSDKITLEFEVSAIRNA